MLESLFLVAWNLQIIPRKSETILYSFAFSVLNNLKVIVYLISFYFLVSTHHLVLLFLSRHLTVMCCRHREISCFLASLRISSNLFLQTFLMLPFISLIQTMFRSFDELFLFSSRLSYFLAKSFSFCLEEFYLRIDIIPLSDVVEVGFWL